MKNFELKQARINFFPSVVGGITFINQLVIEIEKKLDSENAKARKV